MYLEKCSCNKMWEKATINIDNRYDMTSKITCIDAWCFENNVTVTHPESDKTSFTLSFCYFLCFNSWAIMQWFYWHYFINNIVTFCCCRPCCVPSTVHPNLQRICCIPMLSSDVSTSAARSTNKSPASCSRRIDSTRCVSVALSSTTLVSSFHTSYKHSTPAMPSTLLGLRSPGCTGACVSQTNAATTHAAWRITWASLSLPSKSRNRVMMMCWWQMTVAKVRKILYSITDIEFHLSPLKLTWFCRLSLKIVISS